MAKERLSKLQKWILNRSLENKENGIFRDEVREFFGRKFGVKPKWYKDHIIDYHKEGNKLFEKAGLDINDYEFYISKNGVGEEFAGYKPKKDKCSNRLIEATISRSFNGLIKKGFLTKKYQFGKHYLTSEGFLKVNKKENVKTVNFYENYENYINAINNRNEEIGKHYKKLIEDLKKQRHTLENA